MGVVMGSLLRMILGANVCMKRLPIGSRPDLLLTRGSVNNHSRICHRTIHCWTHLILIGIRVPACWTV